MEVLRHRVEAPETGVPDIRDAKLSRTRGSTMIIRVLSETDLDLVAGGSRTVKRDKNGRIILPKDTVDFLNKVNIVVKDVLRDYTSVGTLPRYYDDSPKGGKIRQN